MINKLDNTKRVSKLNSVYSYDEYSLQELLCKFFASINDTIDLCNSIEEKQIALDLKVSEFFEWVKTVGLPVELKKELQLMVTNGTLEQLINEVVLGSINTKIDVVTSEIEQARKGELSLKVKIDKIDEKILSLETETQNIKNELVTKTNKKQVEFTLGTSAQWGGYNGGAWTRPLDYIKTDIDNIVDSHFEELSIVFHTNANGNNVTLSEDIETMYNGTLYAIEKGLKISNVKIHCNEFRTVLTSSSTTLADKELLKSKWLNIVNTVGLKFKGLTDKFIVINEGEGIFDGTYDTFIIDCLNTAKSLGYKCSITTSSVKQFLSLSQLVMSSLDFLATNYYPSVSSKGLDTDISTSVNAYNSIDINQFFDFCKDNYPNKEIYITETGADDRESCLLETWIWDFNNGENYNDGKIQAIALEGIFNAFKDKKINISYWYGLRGQHAKDVIKKYMLGGTN